MKFPKNRANLYLVERGTRDGHVVAVAGFSEYEEAHDFRDACEQEWIDKVGHAEDVFFSVALTTYYG